MDVIVADPKDHSSKINDRETNSAGITTGTKTPILIILTTLMMNLRT